MRKFCNYMVLAVLFPALLAATGLLAYLHFFAPGDRNLSGKWTAALDMTEQVSFAALGWLQDIEGIPLSKQDAEASIQDLTIEVTMALEETARSEGTFQCYVSTESYEACRQAAYEAFAVMFREAVSERMHMAGYDGGTDQEAVEALVEETFGMSAVSYLMYSVPNLLPTLEELQAQYDGSGTYTALEGVLTRQFEAGGPGAVRAERYIRKGPNLILSGEAEDASGTVSLDSAETHYPVIYTLSQAENR